jgi:hypothetical protein
MPEIGARNNRKDIARSIFCVVGAMPIARQRRSKQALSTIQRKVFSVGSVPRSYLENNQRYINDTPHTPDVYLGLFADDTCIYATDRKEGNVLRKMQRGLSAIETWCDPLNQTAWVRTQRRSSPYHQLTANWLSAAWLAHLALLFVQLLE